MLKISDVTYALEKVTIEVNGKDINRYLISIMSKKTGLKLYTTDYTKYIYYSDGKSKRITSNLYKDVMYVVNFLKWCIEKYDYYKVARLEDITFDMCQDYLNYYAIHGANRSYEAPSKAAIKEVRRYISNFLYGIKQAGINEDINKHWIRKNNKKASSKGPNFIYELDIIHDGADNTLILRDIPTEAIELILTCARIYMPLMELPIALQCYAGIREGEICNCRRINSTYGAGIVFEFDRDKVKGVTIVLNKAHTIRSDRIQTGNIKSKINARIYPAFLDAFIDVYDRHLEITKSFKIEDTMPLFVNKSINRKKGCHMAMSVYSYTRNFNKLMSKYVLPIMRKSDSPRLRDFAFILDQNRYGLHWFRHWFSVQLVLAGESWQTLMDYRRDKSAESAITYIRNKKVFMDLYRKANESLAKDVNEYEITKDYDEDNYEET